MAAESQTAPEADQASAGTFDILAEFCRREILDRLNSCGLTPERMKELGLNPDALQAPDDED